MTVSKGSQTGLVLGARLVFPPGVAAHLVKLACELPDQVDRSVSLWTCGQLAIKLTADGTVESISAQSVQRILDSCKLKPWRVHYWLSPKVTRDEAFREQVLDIMALYTRELGADEVAYSLDEKTSLQPRTRSHETKPPRAGNQPALLEHEYAGKGALQSFAAFNWRRRLTAPNFDDLQDLELKLLEFILQWNERAHPFRWSKCSFDKVLAKIDAQLAIAA